MILHDKHLYLLLERTSTSNEAFFSNFFECLGTPTFENGDEVIRVFEYGTTAVDCTGQGYDSFEWTHVPSSTHNPSAYPFPWCGISNHTCILKTERQILNINSIPMCANGTFICKAYNSKTGSYAKTRKWLRVNRKYLVKYFEK